MLDDPRDNNWFQKQAENNAMFDKLRDCPSWMYEYWLKHRKLPKEYYY